MSRCTTGTRPEVLDGSIPYHGFFFEYPPLSLAALVAPKLTGLDYAISLRLLMWLLVAVSLGAVLATLARLEAEPLRVWGAAALIGCAPALVGPILFERFDAWPAALLSVSLLLLTARRWTSDPSSSLSPWRRSSTRSSSSPSRRGASSPRRARE